MFDAYTPESDGLDFALKLLHTPHKNSRFTISTIENAANIMKKTREKMNEQMKEEYDSSLTFANTIEQICFEALHDLFVVVDGNYLKITADEVYNRRGYFAQPLHHIWFYLADICLNVYYEQLPEENDMGGY